MSKFFVNEENVGDKTIIIDSKTDIKHISKVLRLECGDQVDISDGKKWEYKGEIARINSEEVEITIIDKAAFSREPKINITLYQGIPKSAKMDLIVKKSVELGVHKIVPVFMDRTIVIDNGKFHNKIDRWNKISIEASKQCKRGMIPQVSEAVGFGEIFDDLNISELVVFPYENEEMLTIKNLLTDYAADIPKSVALIIGPEGGFSENEANMLKSCGYDGVSLGKTILRTETAGFAAIAMIMYEFEL